ncbi:MAG TPA: hypothetical protein VIA62_13300 [Thermoanaerobaculia bacterium]|jgi:tetratricopeptide (TPR) repeat protein|nr:hypothetical protein [Thermoanaerobaculia bacterium]
MQIHPSDLLLKEAFQERNGSRKVIEHVDSCSWCRQRLKTLVGHHLNGKPPDYGPILDRTFRSLQRWQAEYARERAEAPRLFSSLLGMPPQRRELVVCNHPRFQTWGLLEILLSESCEQIFIDAARSEELANLGLKLAESLDRAHYGAERVEDLRARTWAFIGNSRRAQANFKGAEQAFTRSRAHLLAGTGDVLERASVLRLKRSLYTYQGRFEDALRLSQKLLILFEEAGDTHGIANSLVGIYLVYQTKGEASQGVPFLRQAIPMIDRSLDPRALLCAWNNLIDALSIDKHSLLEAQALLARARPLYRRFPQPSFQGRLKWMEARIACGAGRFSEARELLGAAREELLAAKLTGDASRAYDEIQELPAK